MRGALLLLAMGIAALLLQGALLRFVPPALCPDLGLLLVIALALSVGGASGLLAAALLGFAGDLLSGSLLGQHVLLRVVAFGAVRTANGSLELRRPIPLAILALVATLGHALLLAVTSAWMGARVELSIDVGLELALQAGVNALFAPLVGVLMDSLSARAVEDETPRRGAPLGRGVPLGSGR